MTIVDASTEDGFVHPAFFYASDEEYLGGARALRPGRSGSGQPVAVAVPGERMRLLRAAAAQVLVLDMQVAGRNRGRIIPTVLRRFADAHVSGHVRITGEPIWAGRTDVEYWQLGLDAER
ncbi:hypothetical protein AB0G02_31450 [Actinosynnema sp. NPDC023658]|uniref:hypothetical protein n=1 Tax=Actinosynnema sp. NPDC023658 TaxID=3155465 RepID=UPI0033F9B1B7